MIRRFRLALVAVVLALALHVAHAAPPPVVDAPLDLTTRTLPNGLVVAVVRNPSVPLATVEIGVHNGAMNEPPSLNGLSHLYEHMFFKGNAVIPDQPTYMRRLRALGASWNGTTGTERVNYFFTVGANQIGSAMQFMSDAIKTPRFDAAELNREKAVVLGEFDRNEADPGYHLDHSVTRALFFAHPSYKDPLGTRAAIKAARVDQMRWMQRVYYVPNNSILVVTGDVRPEEIFTLAERFFGDWKAAPNPFIAHPLVGHPPLPAPKTVLVTQPVETVTVRLDWQGPSTGDDMRGAVVADVFSFAANQDGSRLHKALVDSGLANDVDLSYATLRNTGQITLAFETTPDKALAATRVALDEARHFSDPDYLTDAQWSNAQTLLAVADLYERERASEFAHTLSFWFAVDSLQGYRDYIPTIVGTTRAEGAAYAARYIVSRPMVLGVMASAAAQKQHGIDDTALRNLVASTWSTRRWAVMGPAEPAPAPSRRPATSPSPASPDTKRPTLATLTRGIVSSVETFEVAGIPVLLRRNSASPVVAVSTFFRGGSLALTAGNQGIERLALATAATGGTRDMSRTARSQALDAMGTDISYDANADYSRMDMKCVAPFFDRSFDLYAQGIAHPAFAPADLDLARRLQLQAIRQENESPDTAVRRLAESAFFQGHPYALRPIGTEKVVSSLKREAVAGWFARLATPARMLIVVAGDIDRTRVSEAITRGLQGLPSGTTVAPASTKVLARKSMVRTLARALPTTYIRGMMAAASPGDPRYATAYLTAEILSSQLFEELRTRRNLTYSVWAALAARRSNYGVLYVSSTHPNEAVRLMRQGVRNLAAHRLDGAELEGHVATLITNYLLGIETNQDQADQMGHMQIVADGWQEAFTFVDQVRRVTAAQVQAAARGMQAGGIVWGVLGSVKALDVRAFTGK